MAETFSMQPGRLDLEVFRGDEFQMTMTVNRDLTGYTLGASLGAIAMVVTLGTISPESSEVLISLQENIVEALPSVSTWKFWWIAPGQGANTVKRTILIGDVRVYDR